MSRTKYEIQWAVLDENILVLKKPKALSWQQFMAVIFRTAEQQQIALREVLKGFKQKESTIGLDIDKLLHGVGA